MCTVSVIVSNFHKQKYIKEAVQSVIDQTYKDWKLFIIDDSNGEDQIDEIFKELNNPNISLFLTDDIGLSALRMEGVRLTSSKYILFMDADDKIHPDFLKRTVQTLDNNLNFAFAYTDTQHFGDATTGWVQPEYNFHALLENNFICSCSLIRRNSLIDVGGYDLNNFNYWEDYEFWISLGASGHYGKHIPEKLFYYRIHSGSGTQSQRDRILAPLYKSYIITKFPELYPREVVFQAIGNMNKFPPGFMKLKPFEQEEFLKKNGWMQ